MFSNRIPMEKAASSPETMVYSFIHSLIYMRFPNEEPSLETWGKYLVTVNGAPKWMEGLHTMRCGLVPQGIMGRT
jgi:hypothetical protein